MSARGIELTEDHLRRAKAQPKGRISAAVRQAIILMVDEGRTRADAAKECGITDDWLYKALTKPECMAFRNERLQVLRTGEASRSIWRASKLADHAQSEHVQADMTKWLASLDGIAPPERGNSLNVQVNIPGLQLVFAGATSAPMIEGQATEIPHSDTLPAVVEHPALAQKRDE